MLEGAKEEISLLPVIGESILPLAADPAFIETRIRKSHSSSKTRVRDFRAKNGPRI